MLIQSAAVAQDDEDWALHDQATALVQWHPAFHAAYGGPRSLDPKDQGNETADATLYGGAKLWRGGEAWADVELDQGFGLSNTVGLAGFPSGEAYKVGEHRPYFRLPRAFIRQSVDLGGEATQTDSDLNQLAGLSSTDQLVIGAVGAGTLAILTAPLRPTYSF